MLLYADENSPLPVVEELRRRGQDVLTVQEDGTSAVAPRRRRARLPSTSRAVLPPRRAVSSQRQDRSRD